MSARRTMMRWSACSLSMLAACGSAHALEVPAVAAGTHFARAPVERAETVTLGTLSVKPLGVDLRWDPRVCIGCDRNNGPARERIARHRHR